MELLKVFTNLHITDSVLYINDICDIYIINMCHLYKQYCCYLTYNWSSCVWLQF